MTNRRLFQLFILLAAMLLPMVAGAQTGITSLGNISDADGDYIITDDIDASSFTTSIASFSGTLEAAIDPNTKMPYRITGLSVPLFTTLTGTVKNLVLEDVAISQDGQVGAIASTANGSARIYNVGILSGSVGSTGTSIANTSADCCGGLVGLLDGEARVVTCYSYANITGGNRVGGIVGYNNVATASNNLNTMVFGCMFYGEITGSANIAPIYNGKNISNKDANGVSNFNYFRAETDYVQNSQINTYNCALMAETRFLQRFEFFRHILNGHREVAAWWVNSITPDTSEIMKWVMLPDSIGSDHPYPILKKWGRYSSVVNYIPCTTAYDSAHRNQGRKLTSEGDGGVLHVTIQMGDGAQFERPHKGTDDAATITTSSLDLIITDKDTAHFNFNYGKVQLPYYNDVGTKNYTDNRVVTGWKIVSITVNGTATTTGTGAYSTGADVTFDASGNITTTPYNFADRTSTKKDLFSQSGRVFNQGAYWDVPEGVTAITIEPYWAKAAYVSDAYADVVYNTGMGTAYNVSNVGGGSIYTNGNSYTINGESQIVYTSIANAVTALSPNASHTVNDYAVVLVGNYHKYGGINTDKPYTVTTIDKDGDNEPDYSFMLRFDGRTQIHALKYDFLNLVGLGMAQKSTGGNGTYNFGIPRPLGWFEITNTALYRVTQMEYERSNRAAQPFILHGGVFEQWVSAQNDGNGNRTIYFHIGGNVWFKEFHLGCHQDKTLTTKHPPVSVTGGDFDAFYLTGLYSNAGNYEDDAECYINGGRFGTVAGTGMEGIGKTSNHTKGNITWMIDNADITEFFAGGINAAKPAEGNINTIISNSHVGLFCGGPKFGDMNPGKTVKTTANNCIFGLYYGAGFGGNSYYTAAPGNITNEGSDPWLSNDEKGFNIDWDKWVRGEIKASSTVHGNYPWGSGEINYSGYHNDYISEFGGVSVAIDYQFLPMSNNKTNVARLFLKFVKFSLATTRSVHSELTNCTIDSNFYGGGSLGKVEGNVISILDGCIIKGNVFGAGFSATLPEVPVMNTGGFNKQPSYDKNLGVYLPGILPNTVNYTWSHQNTVDATSNAIDTDAKILYTEEDLGVLGTVQGNVTLTIKGNSTIGRKEGGVLKGGNVYGGGDESSVEGDATVTLQEGVTVLGNVYGGGNNGPVGGNTEVKIEDE